MDLVEFLEEGGYDISDCINVLDLDGAEVLKHVSNFEIEEYAESYLDMVSEDDLPEPDLYHFSTNDLFSSLVHRSGYIESLLPNLEDSLKYIQVIGELERNHGYFTFLDKFEEFKQTF